MELVDLSIKLDLSVSSDNLLELAEDAYKVVYEAQVRFIDVEDAEIHVWVEQGSLKYRAKIFAGLLVFYNVVSGIDGFVGGLEKAYQYSNKAINYISEKLVEPTPTKVIEFKRSAGLPEKIKKILRDVSDGRVSVEQGTNNVTKLLQREEADLNIKQRIVDSFKITAESAYHSPLTQLNLFGEENEPVLVTKAPTRRSLPSPIPVQASLSGIELWYDHRTGKKHIKRYVK